MKKRSRRRGGSTLCGESERGTWNGWVTFSEWTRSDFNRLCIPDIVYKTLKFIWDNRETDDLPMDVPKGLMWEELQTLLPDRVGWCGHVNSLHNGPRATVVINESLPGCIVPLHSAHLRQLQTSSTPKHTVSVVLPSAKITWSEKHMRSFSDLEKRQTQVRTAVVKVKEKQLPRLTRNVRHGHARITDCTMGLHQYLYYGYPPLLLVPSYNPWTPPTPNSDIPPRRHNWNDHDTWHQ